MQQNDANQESYFISLYRFEHQFGPYNKIKMIAVDSPIAFDEIKKYEASVIFKGYMPPGYVYRYDLTDINDKFLDIVYTDRGDLI